MHQAAIDIGWLVVFTFSGALTGIILVMCALAFLPRIIDKLTPNIDEEKEIVRGNQAVAEYFGRVVAAGIIGISLIIAAAVLGGIIACLM
ncbi:MAG TPA: DUF350 domain-containing protein [Lentisphaeria bacterium]|nr:DUF350 domain-containing protein [Lentisphaeria bacterium]